VGYLVASQCESVVDGKLNLSKAKEVQNISIFLFPGGIIRAYFRTFPSYIPELEPKLLSEQKSGTDG